MVDNGPWECEEVLSIYIYIFIHVYQVCLFSVWDGWNLEEVLGVCREKKRQKPFWACFWLLVLWFDLWMSKICLLLGWWRRNQEPVSFEVLFFVFFVLFVGRCYTKSLRFSPMSLILLTCKDEVFVVSSSCLLADRSHKKASPTNSKRPPQRWGG